MNKSEIVFIDKILLEIVFMFLLKNLSKQQEGDMPAEHDW